MGSIRNGAGAWERRGAGAFAAALSVVLAAVLGCSRESGGVSVTAEEAKVGRHGAWAQVAPADPPLNVILLTLDTTRQDRLSCYGFPGRTSPHLDSLAGEGILFERALTPVPVTLAAHTTIMTGLYPYQHGVRNNGSYVVPERFTTLAEMLKQRGYETGAVLGGFPLDHRFGLDQGFDFYDDKFPLSSVKRESDTAQRPAAEVTRLGLEWLDGRAGRPFLLWLHYFDPHYPYAAPEPFGGAFPDDPYSGEISYMDAAIGDLVKGLRARGLLEKSVVLVVGDHGESLGEHQEGTHSIFIYNSTQLVPLLLRLPQRPPWDGASWRGRRVKEMVSQVDCLPTLLNVLGLGEPDRPMIAGMSLLPVIEGKEPGHPWVYHETLVPQLEHSWSDLRGLETARWKYVRAPRPELFDLVKDPKEASNLAPQKPRTVEQMEASLSAILRTDIGGESGQVAMDPETIEKLRSLGYVAGAVTQKPAGPAKDPKDMILSYEMVNGARTLVAQHRIPEAAAVLDSVLAQNPDDASAARIRASCLVRLGDGPRAIEAYDRLLASCDNCPDLADLQEGRALAALAAGQTDDAVARARALLAASPRRPGLRLVLAQMLLTQGKAADALHEMEEEARLFPDDPRPIVARADLEAAAGHMMSAEAAYRDALKLNPADADALAGLAEVLLVAHQESAARGYVEQALAADPLHPTALFRKAWFLRKEGRRDDAVYNFLRALAQQPDNVAILYNLGNIYMESNEFSKAQELYERAIRTGRANQQTMVNLGVIHARLGRMKEAIAAWEQALARDPNSPQAASIQRNIDMARAQLGSSNAGAGR